MGNANYISKEKYLNQLVREREIQLLKAYKNSRDNVKSQILKLEEKGVLTQGEIMRFNRLKSLRNNLNAEIKQLSNSTNLILEENSIEQYQEGYNYESFIIDNDFGVDLGYSLVNKEAAKLGIVNPVDEISFIKRNGKNIVNMSQQLNLEITQGILQGHSYGQIAAAIDRRFNIGAKNALRIANTEAHRVRESAGFQSALEAENSGVNIEKMWQASLDEKTRLDHGIADGQKRKLTEYFDVGGEKLMYPGDPAGSAWNVINCRCYKRSIVNKKQPKLRRIRGQGVVPYKNYSTWKKDKEKKKKDSSKK